MDTQAPPFRPLLIGIQARIGSMRLPGKVLKNLDGKSVIEHVYWRCKVAEQALIHDQFLAETVVLSRREPNNQPLANLCAATGIKCWFFEHQPNDVLSRYVIATEDYPEQALVVRVTGDCPLIDPLGIIECVHRFLDAERPLYMVTNADTWPAGMDVEVFTVGTLRAWDRAATAEQREHVTAIHRENDHPTGTIAFPGSDDLFDSWLALDNGRDYAFLSTVLQQIHLPTNLGPGAVIETLDWAMANMTGFSQPRRRSGL